MCSAFICQTSCRSMLSFNLARSWGSKLSGQSQTWIGTKTRKTSVWSTPSTSARLAPSSTRSTWTKQWRVSAPIKRSSKPQASAKRSLTLQTQKRSNVDQSGPNCKPTNWWLDSCCTKIARNSLMHWTYRRISTFTTRLPICTFGFFTSGCVISRRTNLPFNCVKNWLTSLTKWSLLKWRTSKSSGNLKSLKTSKTIYLRSGGTSTSISLLMVPQQTSQSTS